jgi:hypothetical protein
VVNKTIDGKQCTIVWHVDDLKISHEDTKAVDTIINLLDAKYGQEIVGGKRAPVTVTRGKIHDYLGMVLDYSEDGVVKIDMTDNINKLLEELPEQFDGSATTPQRLSTFFSGQRRSSLTSKGTGRAVPFHGDQATLYMQKGLTGYANRCCIPMHTSKRADSGR